MQKLHVAQIEQGNEQYIVSLRETLEKEQASALKAGDRMLVDSEGLAFIYILEDESKFYYLTFPRKTWKNLYQLYKNKIELQLDLHHDVKITLTNIHQELDFLLENIDGNGNYGEDMEKAVREEFH